jgi:hypothetical protein
VRDPEAKVRKDKKSFDYVGGLTLNPGNNVGRRLYRLPGVGIASWMQAPPECLHEKRIPAELGGTQAVNYVSGVVTLS